MPELPEVETVRRGLLPYLEGRRIRRVTLRRDSLRQPIPPDFVQAVSGSRVERLERRAKYLLLHLSNGRVVIAHLGMSGRMTVIAPGAEPPPLATHDHVVFETEDGAEIRFNDARRFGLLLLDAEETLAQHPLLAGIGPEPLGEAFDGSALFAQLQRRKSPVKAILLDQTVVAGIGNIYACEALFAAGIDPQAPGPTLDRAAADRLAAAVRAVLDRAIAAGGSSLRDYVQASGELGYFQHQWAVYGREGQACPGCTCDLAVTGGIARIVQSGRSTFYCPRRQS